MKEGILLRYDVRTDSFGYYRITSFFDETMTLHFEDTHITEIRRSKSTPKQPFTREYVTSLETRKKSLLILYKMKNSVNEKLQISL